MLLPLEPVSDLLTSKTWSRSRFINTAAALKLDNIKELHLCSTFSSCESYNNCFVLGHVCFCSLSLLLRLFQTIFFPHRCCLDIHARLNNLYIIYNKLHELQYFRGGDSGEFDTPLGALKQSRPADPVSVFICPTAAQKKGAPE